MNNQNHRRKYFFANKMQKDILLIVLVASLAPTLIVTVSMYFLIFGITAEQIGIPETIAYNLIPAAKKVILVLLVSLPILITTILLFAHKITHMIVGPFDRIIRELDDLIIGEKKTPIFIRDTDKFWPLVDRINQLIDKKKKK